MPPHEPIAGTLVFLGIVAILLVVFWAVQLVSLMNMRDDEFPGRYDKPLWFVVVFVGSLPGAAIFWIWKRGRRIERQLTREVAGVVASALEGRKKGTGTVQ